MSVAIDTTNSLLGTDNSLLKAYLGISTSDTDSDDIINQCINSSSIWANTKTKRLLKSRDLTEYYSGDGTSTLYPNSYPITAITAAYDDLDRAWGTDTQIDNDDLVIDPQPEAFRIIYYYGYFTPGAVNIKLEYTAGYSTIPSDLQEAVLAVAATMYFSSEEKRLGIASKSSGAGTTSYETGFPAWSLDIIGMYERRW